MLHVDKYQKFHSKIVKNALHISRDCRQQTTKGGWNGMHRNKTFQISTSCESIDPAFKPELFVFVDVSGQFLYHLKPKKYIYFTG